MNISKEIKAALLVLSAIALLIFGYNFLKGKNLLSTDRTYYAFYDNVEGVSTSSKVTVNGMVIGKVLKISLAKDSAKPKITFNVESDFKFGKNSIAKMYSSGIIGGKNISIVPEINPTTFAEGGETLVTKVESDLISGFSEKLDPIQTKLNSTLTHADQMLISVNKMLNEENTSNISKSIKSLTNSLNTLENVSKNVNSLLNENSARLSLTIDSFKKSSDNIDKFSQELSKAEISKLVSDLDKTVLNFEQITQKLNSGNGTAGKLMNDPAVYNNLNRATKQLEQLLQDMKLNPKRYVHFSVFGKKKKDYEKPKDSLK